MTVYHGSNVEFDRPSLDATKDRRDFGRGFYTAAIKEQAEAWAENICRRYKTEQAFIYDFAFSLENLRCKTFDAISKEWMDCIIKNRIQGGIQHDYDVIQGHVADDKIYPTITLLLGNFYDMEYAIKRLAHFKPNYQLSIHTEKALRNLVFREKYIWKP